MRHTGIIGSRLRRSQAPSSSGSMAPMLRHSSGGSTSRNRAERRLSLGHSHRLRSACTSVPPLEVVRHFCYTDSSTEINKPCRPRSQESAQWWSARSTRQYDALPGGTRSASHGRHMLCCWKRWSSPKTPRSSALSIGAAKPRRGRIPSLRSSAV